jgi:lysophospholipase L1-like esterase
VACAGATTSDVISGQVSALSAATTLVSITIGGNDAGFSGVMETCVLRSTSTCLSAVATAETYVTTQLPARLASTLQAIRQRAPGARIVVLGYPDMYDLTKSGTCIGLSTQDRTALNGGADALDSALAKAVTATADRNIVFADVRGQFAPHEICDSGRWLHSVDLLAISSSYHPTASGQQLGYEPVFGRNTG